MDELRDGLEVLRDDHRAVIDLFAEIEAMPAGGATDRRTAMFEQVAELLLRHATAEEELLYPLLRTSVPGGAELADRAVEEHRHAKERLARLRGMSADNLDFDGELRALMAAVREHVTEEESDLLPLLAQHVDEQQLQRLGRALEAAELTAPAR